ncbi:MAG: PEP-CTERM sorting domain-containing protein [Verrucomicrobiaceae bacterium]|nr:MAG: PEP-CTERM sorting domain-containing protein [Verrucomicrobiaceae bacterium]
MNALTRIVVSSFLALSSQVVAQTSLDFNLGGPGETFHESMIFADGGVTVTATAWSLSRTAQNPTFEQGQLVQWSPGIGVKSGTETITNVPYVPYYVDNEERYDFVLFVFSKKVELSTVKIHPSAGTFDLDASYWLGNIDSSLDLTGDSLASLMSSGFGSRINDDSVASNSPRILDITTPSGGVNALLFGARINGDANFDRFKISALGGSTVIPEPSSTMLALGALGLALGRRRRCC